MENMNVQKRDLAVKAKKLRQLGMVPGNVFGNSLSESISIQMSERVARKLFREKREGSKLLLNIDGEVTLVQIKEKSLDTLSNQISHISFQALKSDERVNSVIHIFPINDEILGGSLEKMSMEIPYAALPGDMIDTITIDVEELKTGDILTVKDIPELMNDKIELQIGKDEIILRVNDKRKNVAISVEE